MSTSVILLTSALRRSVQTILGSWSLLFPFVPLLALARHNLASGIIAFLMLAILIYGAIYWAYFHGWKERIENVIRDVYVGWAIIALGAVLLGVYRGVTGFQIRIGAAWYSGILLLGFALLEWRVALRMENLPQQQSGVNGVQNKLFDAIALFTRSLPGLRRGELLLLWTCGLITTFSLISIADAPENFRAATGIIVVIWIACGLIWVSLYGRRRRVHMAHGESALIAVPHERAETCARCFHSSRDHLDAKRGDIGRCQICACLNFTDK
jgi:hypothetical protein